MKTFRQLFRQPLKTLLGVILMTLAVAVLCVCIGQALAAENTKQALDQRFSTVAIPSLQEDLEGLEQYMVDEEMLQWLEAMAQAHPEIIKGVAPNGMISGYIPEMTPYNIMTQGDTSKLSVESFYRTRENDYTGSTYYDSAMLVITLESIDKPTISQVHVSDKKPQREDYRSQYLYEEALEEWKFRTMQKAIQQNLKKFDPEGCSVVLTGTVTQALSVPDGYQDPVGMTARLTLTLPTIEDIEALGLEVGQQYIVYGMDYFDDYQFFVTYMKTTSFKHVTFAPFDPKLLRTPTNDEIRRFRQNKNINVYMIYNNAPLERWQYEMFNTVSMSLCQPSNLIPYKQVVDENGKTTLVPQTSVTYHDNMGRSYLVAMEAYNLRYAVPTIARVNGKVEDFLASEEGSKWQAALEQSQVNNHAFTVVGVEDVHQLPTFSLGLSTLGEGREFTAEEIADGAKVCIIHELVAQQSGLQIGDTITLSLYGTDYGLPYQTTTVQEYGYLRPSASLYFWTTPFSETAEYTIIGFWQGTAWPEPQKNYYSFSANTVFVPQNSVQSELEQRNSLPFVCVTLENGTIDQFHDLAKRSGYAGCFKYDDQDYSQIAQNFHNYEALSQQIMAVGVALYAILLLLFLLMYPTTQKKTVRTMESMGCHYGKRFAHVLVSAMTILVLATVLGGLTGIQLWDRVVAALQATTESTIALELDMNVLKMVAAAQLVLGFGLSMIVAMVIAIPRGISARR